MAFWAMFSTLGYEFTLWILVGLAKALVRGTRIRRHIIQGLFNLQPPSRTHAGENYSCIIWA